MSTDDNSLLQISLTYEYSLVFTALLQEVVLRGVFYLDVYKRQEYKLSSNGCGSVAREIFIDQEADFC